MPRLGGRRFAQAEKNGISYLSATRLESKFHIFGEKVIIFSYIYNLTLTERCVYNAL